MKTTLHILLGASLFASLPAVALAATAQENWTKSCKLCHGADGAGDTPQGKRLKVKNYTDPAVQAAMTDEEMFKATKDGVKSEAGKMVMPAYPKLADEEINDLVKLIRSFAPAPAA